MADTTSTTFPTPPDDMNLDTIHGADTFNITHFNSRFSNIQEYVNFLLKRRIIITAEDLD